MDLNILRNGKMATSFVRKSDWQFKTQRSNFKFKKRCLDCGFESGSNYLDNYLLTNGKPCLEINNNYLDVYLKLIVLLYANDTGVFASSESGKLDMNYVLVFGDRVNRQRNIILRNNRIEVRNEFKYLDVILNKNRIFTSMK